MRRALILIPLLILGFLAWLVFSGGFDDGSPGSRGLGDDTAAEGAEVEKRERVRAVETAPGRERAHRASGNAYQRQFPELGQDLPQDPKLGSIAGRVMITTQKVATGGVLEASVDGKLLARVHIPANGSFHLKNVAPGAGYAIVARLEGHGPGGLDRIGVQAGKTAHVGTVYVGAPIGPNVDNSVRVLVTDDAGDPIAGAAVTATTVYYGALLSLGVMEKQPGGTILRGITDASGEARFEMLPPAAYDVYAVAEGYSFEVRQRMTIQGDTKASYKLRLKPGLSIAGTVVDTDGNPIPNATVGGLRWNEFTSVPAVESDEEGKFSLDGLRSGQPYFLFALKKEIGGAELQNIEVGTTDLLITIELGGDVTFKVTDAASGEALPKFTLRPFRNMPFAYMYAPMIEAESDPEGLYTFRISAADYGVEISHDGYAMKTLPKVSVRAPTPPTDGADEAPKPAVIEVALEPAGVVAGRVVSRLTGEPVVGAEVFVKKGGFPPSKVKDLMTVTAADGTFTLDRLPPRALSLWVAHVDYTEELFEGIEPAVAGAEGEAPAVREFQLGSGGRIEGRAFDDDRVALVGKSLTLSTGFDFLSVRNTTTDEMGRFVFKNVPLGKQYTVSLGGFSPGRTGRSKSGVVVTEGGITTVEFGVETGGIPVTGLVMRNGAPVSGARLRLMSDDGGDAVVEERTDDTGRFTFRSVTPGKYQLSVNGRSSVSQALVVAEEPLPDITIELPTAGVVGVVVDAATGAPLGGVYVECERVEQGGASNISRLTQAWGGNDVTDADGVFSIGSLNDAKYRLRAERDGYGRKLSDDFQIKEGASAEGLRLRLEPACTVIGFVRNAAGVPISAASLTIFDQKGRAQSLVDMNQSSSDGAYTEAKLSPGTYTMTFAKDGYAPSSQVVNVTASGVLTLDFTMLQGGTIELSVKAADETGIAKAVVVVLDAQGAPLKSSFTMENLFSTATLKTNANGQLTISGLAPGTYRLQVEKRNATARTEAIEVFEGGTSSVELRLNWTPE